jgi:photosystem II stability/assembly factor-like uncharacterized protein
VRLLSRIIFLFTIFLSISVLNAFAQSGWRPVSAPTTGDLISVNFTSGDEGWIAGDGGYLASTKDGGRTWKRYLLNTTEDISEIYFRNSDNGYLVAGRKMFITSDGGENWRETIIFKAGDFKEGTPEFLSIRFADRRRGHVVGSVLNKNGDVINSLVMRTEDGGETWQRLIVPSRTELFHLDFSGASHGWIVGDVGVILATADGGQSWTLQNSGTKSALYNVDFRDDNEGYAVGGKGTILRTENGGETWTRVITSFTGTFMRVDFADDKNGWIVGHGGTVLRSSDKGKSWIRQESRTPAHLYGLFMMKKNGWAVGAKGSIIGYQK